MELFALIGVLVSIPALLFVSTLLNGWALHLLWAWLVVPVFPSLPALSISHSIGLAMIATFLTHQYIESIQSDKSSFEKLFNSLAYCILRPILSVFLGWVVHLFY